MGGGSIDYRRLSPQGNLPRPISSSVESVQAKEANISKMYIFVWEKKEENKKSNNAD